MGCVCLMCGFLFLSNIKLEHTSVASVSFLSVLSLFPGTSIRRHKSCNFVLGMLVLPSTEFVHLTPSTPAPSPC